MKIKFLFFITALLSVVCVEKTMAQACGSCATPNCSGIKQYANKAAAQAGVDKIWQNYSPALSPSVGQFTVYATIRTDAYGQVSAMQEFQINGPTTGISTQASTVAASRTYALYTMSDAACATAILPANIANDGSSSTFNPAWTNLQPNTDYKLALKTNLSVLAAGYTYMGFNIRYYNAVRPLATFAFNCGTASAVGTFYANGIGGQNGTLTVPISSTTSGSATFNVSGGGFTGSATVALTTGQTSVSIPLSFDGSGVNGTRAVNVTSSQGTGTCTPNITVLPIQSTFAFNCNTATNTGTFIANGTGGQTGTVVIPLSGATLGQAVFNVSGGGFSGSLTTYLTAGQTSVTVPVTYDGSGVAGKHAVAVSSVQSTNSCGFDIAVQAPTAAFTFNCGTATVSGEFIANGETGQGGFVRIPLTGATQGTATFTVSGAGFAGSLTTQLVNNQSVVSIPIVYDGSGSGGTRPLSISSTQGTGSCSVNATITAPATTGSVTFNCQAIAGIVGTFTANGVAGQAGLLTVNFTTQTVGEVSFAVSGGGFSGSITTHVLAGQQGTTIAVSYDGSGVGGNHAITITSGNATGSCSMNVPVQSIFNFACANFNTSSNFIANGQSQTGNLVIPLSNSATGSATFTVSGNGFTGSLTTAIRDSQRYVSIPVTYDGSAPIGVHAVTVASSQGSGTCTANVKVKDPAQQGCDYISGDNISLQIHSNNTNSNFTTKYILVDENGVIQYSVSAMPFTAVINGNYEAYAVNYSGTAPNLAVGTNFNTIGGSCVSLSNAFPIKVCAAFQFNCGAGNFTGTFIANGTGGQTGTLYVAILNAKPLSTTLTVAGSGFSGTKTESLTLGQDTIEIPITYNGSGLGGIVPLSISAPNAMGTCVINVRVLPPPPSPPFAFDCNSASLQASFIANGATQSGSVTLNISGITADATTNFTATRTNFGGGLTNTVLAAGQTSVAIPIEYNGAAPHGTFNVTIASPHASNNCVIAVPVAIDCTVVLGTLTRN